MTGATRPHPHATPLRKTARPPRRTIISSLLHSFSVIGFSIMVMTEAVLTALTRRLQQSWLQDDPSGPVVFLETGIRLVTSAIIVLMAITIVMMLKLSASWLIVIGLATIIATMSLLVAPFLAKHLE